MACWYNFLQQHGYSKNSHINQLNTMEAGIKIINWFQFKDQPNAQELIKQELIKERIQKLQILANTYNFHHDQVTLRIFGDLNSGIGFTVECPKPQTRQGLIKTLKMYLNSCKDE